MLPRQPTQILIKFRIGDIDAFRILDLGLSVGIQGSNSEGHGDAVILAAVDGGTVERMAALDDEAVVGGSDVCAHPGQVVRHGVDAVGFLDLQFLGIPDDGLAICKACENCYGRDLVNELWYDGALNDTALKARCLDGDICGWLTSSAHYIGVFHIASHGLDDFKYSISGRVDSNILDGDA